jgi:hypothetical protein
MTRDEIIQIALEAGFPLRVLCPSGPGADMGEPLITVVTRFAALIEQRANAWRPASKPPEDK